MHAWSFCIISVHAILRDSALALHMRSSSRCSLRAETELATDWLYTRATFILVLAKNDHLIWNFTRKLKEEENAWRSSLPRNPRPRSRPCLGLPPPAASRRHPSPEPRACPTSPPLALFNHRLPLPMWAAPPAAPCPAVVSTASTAVSSGATGD